MHNSSGFGDWFLGFLIISLFFFSNYSLNINEEGISFTDRDTGEVEELVNLRGSPQIKEPLVEPEIEKETEISIEENIKQEVEENDPIKEFD